VREALLGLLTTQTDPESAWELADVITRLSPAAADRARARAAISAMVAARDDTNDYYISSLIAVILCLVVTGEERIQASGTLLGRY
jgi:hypothetical protein